MLDDGQQIPEEAGLRDVNAEQLWQLVDDDDDADARFEPGEHRFGDEVGDEPEPGRGRQRENQTPTSIASVADAAISSPADPPGAAWPSAAALRIAIVVVVLTLSGRDVPSAA